MTKKELIDRLAPFDDDIKIYIPFALEPSPIEQIDSIDYILSDRCSDAHLVLTSDRLFDKE